MLEQEIKLIVDSQEILDSIIQCELLQPHLKVKLEPSKYVAQYHDTSNRDFTRLYSSLRSRMEGELMRATFKEKGSIVDGFSQHLELHAVIDDWLQTPSMLPEGSLKRRVLQIVDEHDLLETIVTVEMVRTVLELNISNTKIECAADRGYIFANQKSVQLFEFELELKHGNLQPMRQLAEELKNYFSLSWSNKTKLALGMELWNT
ncbi:MAG: CYTH domain-containing protein [Gammaproteobacteria bacterium]|nr:CYTH domain-containing protein [Gammaproteobacteria bacterium]MCY4219507.1 CYTH domain-containing protein [Gammaproteobacteria bacterium]MCY4274786.1 CYTH domain-containing protein [Gammaproteobacteria bacterium]